MLSGVARAIMSIDKGIKKILRMEVEGVL